ncbi:hypothetical protein Cob_v005121 [Colletotrichum orbiculare MAFF 240422]|uniref:Uncharacterized protein n=1 Tax=Colletotrichum orbiculare (strain 104-T / ATCC 96160 / CBS 514.97 / LARS 414 / MAFF 240422) TaxID=1213857 RepID=N4V0F3_COLOR|nr:hypothetical protein Cob_v005121 [Colletotrichum orbiculare MAFF 240422]
MDIDNPTFDHFLQPEAVPSYKAVITNTMSKASFHAMNIQLPKTICLFDGADMAQRGTSLARGFKDEAVYEVNEVRRNRANTCHHVLTETDGILVRARHTEPAIDELLRATTTSKFDMEWQVAAEFAETGGGIEPITRHTHTAAEARVPIKQEKERVAHVRVPAQVAGRKTRHREALHGDGEKNEQPWISGRVDMISCLGKKGTTPQLYKGAPSKTTRPIVCVEAKRHGMLQRAKTRIAAWAKKPVDEWLYQVGGVDCGAITGPIDPNTLRLFQQGAFYAIIYRTKYIELQDHAESILLEFTGLEIRSDVVASELWREGLGETMTVTVLTGAEVQPGTFGFRCMARENTPLDTLQMVMETTEGDDSSGDDGHKRQKREG